MYQPRVSLTRAEWEDACAIGELRRTESRRRNIEDTSCSQGDDRKMAMDKLGACAEAAFCKWRGVPWEKHVNTGHRIPDVHPYFEIRSSELPNGRMIVRRNDASDRLYVLVTGDLLDSGRTFVIRGWMGGGGAKRDEWWDNPRNAGWAWWVPQKYLFDPNHLRL